MRLLPELWRVIFQIAAPTLPQVTYISSLIDDWPSSEFETFSPTAQRHREEHNAATATKLKLVRVCKQWYSIAIELLYEDIRPTDVPRLGKLLELLKTQAGEKQCGLGWWTRLLRTPELPYGKDDEFVDLLVEITSHLPNLRTLFIEGWFQTDRDHDRLAHHLTSACPSLRYLFANHWQPSRKFGTISYLRIPSLRYAKGVWGRVYNPMVLVESDKLTALALSFEPDTDFPLNGFHLPSLQHLRIRGNFSHPIPGILHFFKQHGPQLDSLAVDFSSDSVVIDDMLQCCTALREFLVIRPRAAQWKHATYPSVRTVGVCIAAHDGFGSQPTVKSGQLPAAIGLQLFPNLQRVKVVDIDLGNSSRKTVRRVQALFVNRGDIAFEDAAGNAITEPLTDGGPDPSSDDSDSEEAENAYMIGSNLIV